MNQDNESNTNLTIAIPTENGRLHGHFGGCRQFALVEIDPTTHAIVRTRIVPAPEHQPGLFPRWLREQGVRVVLVGGIGHRALEIFAHHGIEVRAGFPDAPIEELVVAYLKGQLTSTPAGCEHHEHEHGHHHHEQDHDHGHGHGHRHGHHQDGGTTAPSTEGLG